MSPDIKNFHISAKGAPETSPPRLLFGTVLGAAGLGAMAVLPAGAPLWVPMVVMAAVGIGTGSVRWNGRRAAIAAERQAIRYSHIVDEPLSRISARLMT